MKTNNSDRKVVLNENKIKHMFNIVLQDFANYQVCGGDLRLDMLKIFLNDFDKLRSYVLYGK